MSESYELRDVIKLIFNLNNQIVVNDKTKMHKTKNTSSTLEQYVG